MKVLIFFVPVFGELYVPPVSTAVCDLPWLASSGECRYVLDKVRLMLSLVSLWESPNRISFDDAVPSPTVGTAKLSASIRRYLRSFCAEAHAQARQSLLATFATTNAFTGEFAVSHELVLTANEVKSVQDTLPTEESASLSVQLSAVTREIEMITAQQQPAEDRLGPLRELFAKIEREGKESESKLIHAKNRDFRAALKTQMMNLAQCSLAEIEDAQKAVIRVINGIEKAGASKWDLWQATIGADAPVQARMVTDTNGLRDRSRFVPQQLRLQNRREQVKAQLATLAVAHSELFDW